MTKKSTSSRIVVPADMPIHPLALLFPPMTAEEKAAFAADIQANGVKHPVSVWNGTVLDGRNRLEVCRELGIDCPGEEIECAPDQIRTLVFSANLFRRNLSSAQRAAIAVKAGGILDGSSHDDDALDAIAQSIGTNRTYLRIAERLKEHPDLMQQVILGSLQIQAAAKQIGLMKKQQPPPPKDDDNEFLGDDELGAGSEDWDDGDEHEALSELEDDEEGDGGPPSIKDGFGHDVPEEWRWLFEARSEFAEIHRELIRLKKRAGSLALTKPGIHLSRAIQTIGIDIDNAAKAILESRPHCMCKCQGKGCDNCKDAGFLTAAGFRGQPDSIKHELQGAA